MPESLLQVAKRVDQFFMGASPIHEAMSRLSSTLQEMGIPFAIAGAMAANAHGHRRTTDDIDVLLTAEGLEQFKQRCLGRGWLEKFEGSKNLRDTVCNVNIDVLLSGNFPGDGRPKPVAFPSPESVSETLQDGIPFLPLPVLLELKLASGMTAPHRPRDLDDVIQLIRRNKLPEDYGDSLNAYVAEKYREMWRAAQVEDDF